MNSTVDKLNFLDQLVQRKTFALLVLALNVAGLGYWLYRSEVNETRTSHRIIQVLEEVKEARDQCQDQLIRTIQEHNLVLLEDKERMYRAIEANTEANRQLKQAIESLERRIQ